jgi:hypothetical protein
VAISRAKALNIIVGRAWQILLATIMVITVSYNVVS